MRQLDVGGSPACEPLVAHREGGSFLPSYVVDRRHCLHDNAPNLVRASSRAFISISPGLVWGLLGVSCMCLCLRGVF